MIIPFVQSGRARSTSVTRSAVRRAAPLLIAVGLVLPFLPSPRATAAAPQSGTVSLATPTITWQGAHYAAGATTYARTTCVPEQARFLELCDHYVLTVDVPVGHWDDKLGGVEVSITWPDPANAFAVGVFPEGEETSWAGSGGGTNVASVRIPDAAGVYDVFVVPTDVTDSSYVGTAALWQEPVPTPTSHGPCTDAAMRSMAGGAGHDHRDVTDHGTACGMTEVFFDGLADELAAQPDVVLGEMDVERDLLAIAVTFPESGVLFFDVSDPAKPELRSWYRGSQCEVPVQDTNCGAFIDLSPDGTVAFLSVQSTSLVPGRVDPAVRPVSTPGVEVIDVSDPAHPVLTQAYPVVSTGGVHTARSHVIPAGATDRGPRAPGEYLFSIANGLGIEVSKVSRVGGLPLLTPVTRIDIDEVHDTFIQDDPLDGRTYLYVAAGLESGFYVYDVTDPGAPSLKAEWDLTPGCPSDWYGHTVDVAVRNGRRYVTLDAETFDLGPQPRAEQDRGCGAIIGNGDKPGPLWIIDATNLGALGPAVAQGADDDNALRARSEAALVATWTNPASRPGGHLLFSPHNQQIVGDRIYLSHYHGGVYVLDASAAFRGEHERPRELGVYVPSGAETRPDFDSEPDPITPFMTKIPVARTSIWDAVYHRGYVFAADEHGGLYSLRYDEELAGAPPTTEARSTSTAAAPGPTPAFTPRLPRLASAGRPMYCLLATSDRRHAEDAGAP